MTKSHQILIGVIALLVLALFVPLPQPLLDLSSGSLASLLRGSSRAEADFERVQRTNTLRCGYVLWPPFLDQDPQTGEMKGVIADVMDEIAIFSGLKIIWAEEVSKDTMFLALDNNHVDAICGTIIHGFSRRSLAAFTRPLFYAPVGLFARADDLRFSKKTALPKGGEGLRLAALEGSTLEGQTRNLYPAATVMTLSPEKASSDVLANVADKDADLALMDSATGKLFMEANPGKLRTLEQARILLPTTFAVARGERALMMMLNGFTEELLTMGVMDNILKEQHMTPHVDYWPVALTQAPEAEARAQKTP